MRIDRETLEPRFRVIGSDLWSDEPGFAEAIAESGVTGICGSGIVEVIAELYLAGVITADGIIDGRLAARTPRVVADGRTFSYLLHEGTPRILVTQNDVRAIQLAKAALYAGTRLLMDHLGVDAVEQVRLAGAFGSQIDPFHAMVLGLVPDCELERVEAAGNAAGTGALIALLSANARRGDRDPGAPRGEDRDGRRAALPGALRGGHGHPPQDRADPEPRPRRRPADPRRRPTRTAANGRSGRRRGADRPTTTHDAGRSAARPVTDGDGGAPMTDEQGRRRAGGRAARQAARAHDTAVHPPFLTRTMAPFEVLSEEGLALIEHNADTILEEVGIDFRGDADALRAAARGRRRRPGRARPLPARHVPDASSRPPPRTTSGRSPATRRATSTSAA